MITALEKGQMYQHYKGNFYKIVDLGYNSETDDREQWVAYQALYTDPELGENPLFFQSVERFCSPAIVNGKEVARFVLVNNKEQHCTQNVQCLPAQEVKDNVTTVQQLKNVIEETIQERDWVQFHSAKNCAMALAIEAAELMEFFRFLNDAQSSQLVTQKRIDIEHELADVLFWVLAFSNRYDVDISTAFMRKMEINKQKYPVDKCKGRADKYTAYQ